MKVCRNVYFVHDDGSAELKIESKTVLIDANFVDSLSKYQWSIGTHGYAVSGCGRDQILMHRFITGAKGGCQVDHINRNKLDNRRENLRLVTAQQNRFNSGIQSNNTSGYKGVCQTESGKWQAQIALDRKSIYLGLFDDAVSAAKAYDTAAVALFGEYASPNMTDEKSSLTNIAHTYKLSFDQVNSIRALYAEGFTIRHLSDLYSHSYSSILRVVRNKTFKKDAKI